MGRTYVKNDQSSIVGYDPDNHRRKAGVYGLVDDKGESVYVGSTLNLGKRMTSHLSMLSNGDHPNRQLQDVYNRHGRVHLIAEVIDSVGDRETTLSVLRIIEEEAIADVKAKGVMLPMNVQLYPTAKGPATGLSPSAETREKLSVAMRGRYVSEETRRLRSATMSGRTLSDECKAAISDARTAYTVVIDDVEYRNSEVAAKAIGITRSGIRSRCLSDKFPNYRRRPVDAEQTT